MLVMRAVILRFLLASCGSILASLSIEYTMGGLRPRGTIRAELTQAIRHVSGERSQQASWTPTSRPPGFSLWGNLLRLRDN
jgi:hypothetical protein